MRTSSLRQPRLFAENGTAAVEFAVVALLFFTVIFGIIELARIMYVYNTLAEVTQSAARSAANIDWRHTDELNVAKQKAIFRSTSGNLPFGAPITDQHIRIDYLALKQSGTTTYEPISAGSMPGSPGRNRHSCLTNSYGSATSAASTCIRIVRARICKPDTDCEPVDYQTLFLFSHLGVQLPTSTTLVSAETLGYRAGDPISP